MILVTHNAHFNGAQLLALHIAKALRQHFGYQLEIICLEGGVLLPEFKKYGNVQVLNQREALEELATKLWKKDFRTAICNTVISGELVEKFSTAGIRCLSLIHELPGVIHQYKAEEKARKISENADCVVFPSRFVHEKFNEICPIDTRKSVIMPQGLFKVNKLKDRKSAAREKFRSMHRLPEEAHIVLGVGFADHRKGIDLFCEVASKVRQADRNTYFVWVGSREPNVFFSIKEEQKKNVIFLDPANDIDLYYAAADLYLLTSREDPFPTVVLDALSVGVPVIGFREAGGFVDIVTEQTGALVDYLNTEEMAAAVLRMLSDREAKERKGAAAIRLVESRFYFLSYVYRLLDVLGHEFKRVTAIVPNYNYAKYLPDRIDSILNQTYPIYELVLLDDGSSDGSRNWLQQFEADRHLRVKKKLSASNSGSVFKQWAKGINQAEGEFVWIAEADDLCSSRFLQEVMRGFHYDPDVVLSYSQSKQIDQRGDLLASDYLDYTNELDRDKWKRAYIREGIHEIRDTLVVKNTIPNVSGAVFKNMDYSEILPRLPDYKIAGDWMFYVWLLQKGKISYVPAPLNMHRRHSNSVTTSENKQLHYREVTAVQDYILDVFEVTASSREKVELYRTSLQNYLGIVPNS
ncbi:glycosyltransferase [Cohnella candidum]